MSIEGVEYDTTMVPVNSTIVLPAIANINSNSVRYQYFRSVSRKCLCNYILLKIHASIWTDGWLHISDGSPLVNQYTYRADTNHTRVVLCLAYCNETQGCTYALKVIPWPVVIAKHISYAFCGLRLCDSIM